MSDTQVLLQKIAALRQRLEQAQGLAHDVGSAAASLPAEPARVQRLERHVADGDRHNVLLDCSLRQVPSAAPTAEAEPALPAQLTARASRVLRHGQELLRQLRQLAAAPPLQDESDPLAHRYRETVAMADAVLRMVQGLPNTPGAQLRVCAGIEAVLAVVADRVAGLVVVLGQRRADAEQVGTLGDRLTELAEGRLREIKPFVLLAETVLADALQGGPLRFSRPADDRPVSWVATHSLNVARVAARVVRHDPDLRGRALDPVLAALLHDAGMLRVPAGVFLQKGPLDDAQRRAVERHVLAGAELAVRLLPAGGWLAEAAAAHHERLDGTGYPAGLRDAQIGGLTRLVAVCDVYAALCSPRPHRPALEPRTALTDTLLLAEQGGLDRFQAEHLLHLSFYPVGTVVELADGAVGVVVATHQGRRELNTPARPVLTILTDGRRRALPVPHHLDLAECEGRSIVRSLPLAERRELLGGRYPELV